MTKNYKHIMPANKASKTTQSKAVKKRVDDTKECYSEKCKPVIMKAMGPIVAKKGNEMVMAIRGITDPQKRKAILYAFLMKHHRKDMVQAKIDVKKCMASKCNKK
jgi:hypothetical protein